MWNKFRNSRAFYLLLSILAAILCWLYVDLAESPDARVTINNIPVSYVGEEALTESGLMALDEEQTINITVEGTRSVITKLNRSNITITASVSNIDEAGVYSVNCSINLPSAVISTSSSQVRVVSQSASAVDVTVVELVTKTVPIRAEFTGTVAENRTYDDDSFVLQQKELDIEGEASAVNSVSYAKVVLSETGLTDTWTGWLDIVLCDQEGNELSLDNLSLEVESISVAFYVECTKELALTVTLVSGGGATEENAVCTIEPSTIQVSGQEVVLDELEEINLGSVDLGEVVTSWEGEFEITLPSGVSSLDDVTTATVQVSISGLETQRITTSNIQLVNAPEGYTYTYDPLEVRVRGSAEGFEALMSEDVEVTLDMSDVEVSDGATVTVPAQVEVVGISELGVVGTYSVEVTVTAEQTDETETATDTTTTQADS